jgi:hypothetical protein
LNLRVWKDYLQIADVERLPYKPIDPLVWKDCFRHANNLAEEYFAKEMVQDEVTKPIVVNLMESDSYGSDTDNDLCLMRY